jgi:hypothetical protein
MKYFYPIIVLFFSSCTISLSLVNTHGTASDVVDSTPTTETKTDAQVEVPLKAL